MVHIVVIGAGALGAYFGSRFEEAGADVTFLVREKRADQIRKSGIQINSAQGDYTIDKPSIVTDIADIESPDLVLLSVKGYHLQGTFKSLQELTRKGAYVLPVLNGIEHIRLLQEQVGKEAVLGGLSLIIATLNERGHVEHSSDFHSLVFGALDPSQATICKQLEKLADMANMTAINSENILLELWKKYMFINAFSGITTATNLPIGPIRANEETFQIAINILEEMKLLATRYHVHVTDEDIEMAKKNLLHLQEEATSSMHQDRRKGLTLEVDHLHGGAIRLAEAAGVELPYTKAIYGIIKPFENA